MPEKAELLKQLPNASEGFFNQLKDILQLVTTGQWEPIEERLRDTQKFLNQLSTLSDLERANVLQDDGIKNTLVQAITLQREIEQALEKALMVHQEKRIVPKIASQLKHLKIYRENLT